MEIYSATVKSHWQTDILVIGGGPAGVTAALAAAEHGAAVTLVERYGFLGGISTQVIDTFCGFYPPGDAASRIVWSTNLCGVAKPFTVCVPIVVAN
jgi:heterodisulfide reductase subunit A-like polyferredoxin